MPDIAHFLTVFCGRAAGFLLERLVENRNRIESDFIRYGFQRSGIGRVGQSRYGFFYTPRIKPLRKGHSRILVYGGRHV